MPQPNDYRHIRAWHHLTGSQAYYWKNLQRQAAEENAPLTACFRNPGNEDWTTIEQVKNKEFIAEIDRYLEAH